MKVQDLLKNSILTVLLLILVSFGLSTQGTHAITTSNGVDVKIDAIADGLVIPVDVSGAPILPSGADRISQAYDVDTSGNSLNDYTVSSGKKLIIQLVFCSLPNGEQADKQLRIRYQFRPIGTNTYKATIYAQDSKPFPNILNDGSPQPWLEAGEIFRTRFENDSGISTNMYGGWVGYEIDL